MQPFASGEMYVQSQVGSEVSCDREWRCSEELVVQDEKDQEDEADDDPYGNQFLLFGPAARKAKRGDEVSQARSRKMKPQLTTTTYRRIILDSVLEERSML